jgi:anaerobic magnesium-protoporphyrin IX monomethyl ester cyclase
MRQDEAFRVSLISPPSRAKSVRPPLGLMYLASSIKEKIHDVQVDIIDLQSSSAPEVVLEEIVNSVKRNKPRLVGISCLSTDMGDVKRLVSRIKKEDEDILTVVGGIHPTLFPTYFFEESDDVNFVVMGEGEVTLVELVKGIRTKGNLGAIDGIAYKHQGKVCINKQRDPIKDMDKIPFPAFDLVDMEYYTMPSEWVIRGVPISGFFIFTGRGCPYACKFCVNKNLSNRTVRLRSARNVVDELEFLIENYHIDGFFIYDDAFGLNRKRALEVCDEIIKRKLDLVWGCQARVNLLTEDMIRRMKEAGCIQLEFGVESGSQRILDNLQKQIKVEDTKKIFKLCDTYGMRKLANFLINTPEETKEDVEATLSLATEIGANVNLFNITTLFPGSDLYYEFKKDIPEEDLVKFASQDNIEEFLDIIESKYKLSSHDIPLSDLLATISQRFPVRGKLSLRWNRKYLIQMWKLISFMFTPRYIKVIITSKKKRGYLKMLFSLISHLFSK